MKILPLMLKNTASMVFLGGYPMEHPCRNFIGRYTPYLPMIVVLPKPQLATGHHVTEADSMLFFKQMK
jgi:hypothetical protein